MEKDTTDLNHNLLRGKVAQAFEKKYLKEIEGKKRKELIQYKRTRHRHVNFMAKFRAKENEEETRRHKSMLPNIAEKIQQAPEVLAKTIQQKLKYIRKLTV
ncbi:LOW QUALITY PROTEIN: uncharacterized protein RDI95_000813 [Morus bassanus]